MRNTGASSRLPPTSKLRVVSFCPCCKRGKFRIIRLTSLYAAFQLAREKRTASSDVTSQWEVVCLNAKGALTEYTDSLIGRGALLLPTRRSTTDWRDSLCPLSLFSWRIAAVAVSLPGRRERNSAGPILRCPL